MFGEAAEPGKNVPGREAADHLGVVGVRDRGDVRGEPSSQRADLLVDYRQDPAGGEQFLQIGGGPRRVQSVGRLVGQFNLAAAQPLQKAGGPIRLWLASVEPGLNQQRLLRCKKDLRQGF